jgi:hypothetical protein
MVTVWSTKFAGKFNMPPFHYRAMLVALSLYVVVSPLSTYNTLALFGLVQSRLVPVQLTITAIMIVFAIIAGRPLGKHCSSNTRFDKLERWLWTGGFYIIGPPVLFAYYRLRFKNAIPA